MSGQNPRTPKKSSGAGASQATPSPRRNAATRNSSSTMVIQRAPSNAVVRAQGMPTRTPAQTPARVSNQQRTYQLPPGVPGSRVNPVIVTPRRYMSGDGTDDYPIDVDGEDALREVNTLMAFRGLGQLTDDQEARDAARLMRQQGKEYPKP